MEYQLNFDAVEMNKLKNALITYNTKVINVFKAGVKGALDVVAKDAKNRAPFSSIKNSIRPDKNIISNWDEIIGRVRATSSLSHLYELGTGIYGKKKSMIYPKEKDYLVFKPKGRDYFVKAKFTKGVKKQPFLFPAATETKSEQLKAYQDAYRAAELSLKG